ncbi:Heat shock protein C [Xanthomonas citri pv. fuscans]|uniref:Heat shock protein C n=1 Tax=Xanthomonas citri pv. fuscans TaxID=366649 RepID=A0AB34Q2Z8_XANCI|nr:heat-shock protein C [Xanthomonas citri]KGU50172.1 Heat shock protein C [Xanthomonas citri pv. fuscans]
MGTTVRKEYFRPVWVGGQQVDLSHLDPFTMKLHSERLNKPLRIAVTFSTHCFSEAFGKIAHPDGDTVIDHDTKRPRTFCPTRYALSKTLRDVVQAMADKTIIRTAFKRNWVHTITVESPVRPYHVFVEIQRAAPDKRTWQDLELVVESAYHQTGEPPSVTGSPRTFMVVCAEVYSPPQGKPGRKRRR